MIRCKSRVPAIEMIHENNILNVEQMLCSSDGTQHINGTSSGHDGGKDGCGGGDTITRGTKDDLSRKDLVAMRLGRLQSKNNHK